MSTRTNEPGAATLGPTTAVNPPGYRSTVLVLFGAASKPGRGHAQVGPKAVSAERRPQLVAPRAAWRRHARAGLGSVDRPHPIARVRPGEVQSSQLRQLDRLGVWWKLRGAAAEAPLRQSHRDRTKMGSFRPWILGLGGLCVVVAVGCGGAGSDNAVSPTDGSSAGSAVTATGALEVAPPTLFGVAGLIPPNFPDPTQDDWKDLFASFPETGTMVGVYQNWNDGPGTQGQVPDAVQLIYTVAEDTPIVPIIGLGVKERTPDDGLKSTVDYDNPVERQQVIDTLVTLVEDFDVDYLLFGAEINRLLLYDPDAFDAFVALYADTYDAVKATSPATLMFTGFQLELMRGDAFLMGDSDNRDPQWDHRSFRRTPRLVVIHRLPPARLHRPRRYPRRLSLIDHPAVRAAARPN